MSVYNPIQLGRLFIRSHRVTIGLMATWSNYKPVEMVEALWILCRIYCEILMIQLEEIWPTKNWGLENLPTFLSWRVSYIPGSSRCVKFLPFGRFFWWKGKAQFLHAWKIQVYIYIIYMYIRTFQLLKTESQANPKPPKPKTRCFFKGFSGVA